MFIEQPEGSAKTAEDGAKLVCKLTKSIYGLKQASKNSFDRLKTNLLHESFQQRKSDYCLYVKREDSSLIYVLV